MLDARQSSHRNENAYEDNDTLPGSNQLDTLPTLRFEDTEQGCVKMKGRNARRGVIFVGPGADSQGGIAAVISNYRKTAFWTNHRCYRYSSTKDHGNKLIGAVADIFRVFLYAATVWYPNRPAAVSIHSSHSGSFYRKLAYILISKLFHIPVVLHIHPAAFVNFHQNGNGLRRACIRAAGKLSDQVVCLSTQTSDALSDVFGTAKLRTLGNPVDIALFERQYSTQRSGRPQILFMGWIVKSKGVYDLVDAIPTVLKHFPNAIFLFAGNKEIDSLRRMISERGLDNSAEVLGWVSGRQKLDLIHSSYALVLPSYTEGLPNVILEAMAGRLPIITTPVGGIPSVLEDEKTAVFIEPGNVDSIAEAIVSLLTNERKSTEISNSAFQHVCRQYSLDAISRGLEDIYSPYIKDRRNFLTLDKT
jgi:glycosyltransferase involved in cell wall biosynthesis